MGYNKKLVVLLTLQGKSSKKKKLEHRYWQTKCWGDWICDDESLIYDKIRGHGCCVLFYAE
jgi:hypothetical protein